MFLGDPSVGKTCLAKLYINRNVQEETLSTIGFDIQTKDLTVNGVLCRVSNCYDIEDNLYSNGFAYFHTSNFHTSVLTLIIS